MAPLVVCAAVYLAVPFGPLSGYGGSTNKWIIKVVD
jgi:hypothetical protein